MGTSLSKVDSEYGCDSLSGSSASSQQQEKNKDVMLQWRAWMARAEGLYLQGKLKACREVSAILKWSMVLEIKLPSCEGWPYTPNETPLFVRWPIQKVLVKKYLCRPSTICSNIRRFQRQPHNQLKAYGNSATTTPIILRTSSAWSLELQRSTGHILMTVRHNHHKRIEIGTKSVRQM